MHISLDDSICRFKLGDSAALCKVTDIAFNPLESRVQLNVTGFDSDCRKCGMTPVEFVRLLKSAAESMIIRQLLPQSTVFISLSILSCGGSLFSMCCNAIYASCLQYGIPVKRTAFVTVCLGQGDTMRNTLKMFVNPQLKDLHNNNTIVEVALIDGKYHVAYSSSSAHNRTALSQAISPACQEFDLVLHSLLDIHRKVQN